MFPLIYTGLSSGLRQCELITLSWADFLSAAGISSGTAPAGPSTARRSIFWKAYRKSTAMCSSTPRPERRISFTSSITSTSGYSNRQGCRGWLSGICSANAWRWGYDAERVYPPLAGSLRQEPEPPDHLRRPWVSLQEPILPRLGEIPLEELSVEQVGDFLEEPKAVLAVTARKALNTGLRRTHHAAYPPPAPAMLDQAIRDGLITDNPARAFCYQSPRRSAPMC